jgi:hypothetical protein
MAFVCDIDGVVANFCTGFSKLLHEMRPEYPIVKPNDSFSWDWKEWYNGGIEKNPFLEEDLETLWEDNIKILPDVIWSKLDPLFPMVELIDYAKREPLVFMTRRDGPRAWEETVDWLRYHGVMNPMVYAVKSGEEKGEVCKKMGLKTIIDDSPRNAVELLMNGINVVMPRWSYNQKFIKEYKNKANNLYVVNNLNEALVTAKLVNDRS